MTRDFKYQARLHLIIFLWPIILLFLGGYFYFGGFLIPEISYLLLFVGLGWLIMTWFVYAFSALTVSRHHVVIQTGFLVRKTTDYSVPKIESIDISQSILGSICKYGTLIITGTGGSRHRIHHIKAPLTCRRRIEEVMYILNKKPE